MDENTFQLKNRDEVALFDSYLSRYSNDALQVDLPYISLSSAYDLLNGVENGSKVFTALLDLKLNFYLLYFDIFNAGATWNSNFSKGKLEGGSILDSYGKFSGKLELHKHLTSYVFRYRALWDKIMGLLVLTLEPNRYDDFTRAKSKKKTFSKIVREISLAEGHIPEDLSTLLEHFDNNYRTAEAHGTGSLRKYTFSMSPLHENPQIELVQFWNIANKFVTEFGNNLELLLSYHYPKPAPQHS